MKKRKAGGLPPSPELTVIMDNLDDYLFSKGLAVADYFVEGTVDHGMIGFQVDGRDYDLLVDDEMLARAIRSRLIELGVNQRRLP